MIKKRKRLMVCLLCGHSGDGNYWLLNIGEVCESCVERYFDDWSLSHDLAKEYSDLEGYVKERMVKA